MFQKYKKLITIADRNGKFDDSPTEHLSGVCDTLLHPIVGTGLGRDVYLKMITDRQHLVICDILPNAYQSNRFFTISTVFDVTNYDLGFPVLYSILALIPHFHLFFCSEANIRNP